MGPRVAVGLVFDASALIDIVDAQPTLLTLIARPPRALFLVRTWGRQHLDELAEDWALARALQPLVPIPPLD